MFVPAIDTYPAPVREVRVLDAGTGLPVASAKATCLVAPDTYKGPKLEYERDVQAVPGAGIYENERAGVTRLKVVRSGDGRFSIDRRSRLVWWQCIWPLGWATPGDWIYHGHKTEISVAAPGYLPQRIEYWTGLTRKSFKAMPEEGVLVFGLVHLSEDIPATRANPPRE